MIVLFGAYLAYGTYKTYKPLKASPGGLEETISVSVMKLVDLAFRLAYIGVIVWAGGILVRNNVEAYKPPPRRAVRASHHRLRRRGSHHSPLASGGLRWGGL